MTRYSRGAAASAADILVSFEPEPAAEVRGAVLAGLRAHNRGVLRVYLDTLDFQARPFYEREGYVVFGVQEDYPPGHQRFYMRKELGSRRRGRRSAGRGR